MSVHDLILVAEKRPWVPEWLFAIAKHWLPLAHLLCRPIRCAWGCGEAATMLLDGVETAGESWPQGVPTCDFHYDVEMVYRRTR